MVSGTKQSANLAEKTMSNERNFTKNAFVEMVNAYDKTQIEKFDSTTFNNLFEKVSAYPVDEKFILFAHALTIAVINNEFHMIYLLIWGLKDFELKQLLKADPVLVENIWEIAVNAAAQAVPAVQETEKVIQEIEQQIDRVKEKAYRKLEESIQKIQETEKPLYHAFVIPEKIKHFIKQIHKVKKQAKRMLDAAQQDMKYAEKPMNHAFEVLQILLLRAEYCPKKNNHTPLLTIGEYFLDYMRKANMFNADTKSKLVFKEWVGQFVGLVRAEMLKKELAEVQERSLNEGWEKMLKSLNSKSPKQPSPKTGAHTGSLVSFRYQRSLTEEMNSFLNIGEAGVPRVLFQPPCNQALNTHESLRLSKKKLKIPA